MVSCYIAEFEFGKQTRYFAYMASHHFYEFVRQVSIWNMRKYTFSRDNNVALPTERLLGIFIHTSGITRSLQFN
jgi:hypothetical protein